ncbi:transmembrane 220 family protein [Pontibacter sp. BT310]|uniref:Transmembrane 220 family protein n=1 Tax=Pontibacter populi TaxID=890055 RepID=A0ABS6XD90_9BACT|nr:MULTISPECIES: transmembrane 220 family protein [Pontibacter]MBJ6119101.1 transmembrane 220 family protein [Pontibacter sp. BT310]MBR0571529.1 transmembrane 220 family protein [Microvirga sp. STS03]MBW3365955.1 transmembrane 220 family protein [Pontibacter populi]
MLRKIIGIILGLVFISFAAMQYNDPDATVWILIYLYAAAITILAAFGKVPVLVLAITTVTCLLGAFYMWPEKYEGLEVGGGDIKNIEEAREALGLLLIGVIMFLYAIMPGRVQKINHSPYNTKG